MKKIMKKLICMLLVLVSLLTVFAPSAYAAAPTDAVAEMSIFSYMEHPFDTGHAWLYFKNISNNEITVGKYVLQPGEGVSVGTFKNTRNDGAGVYYNVESWCTARYGTDDRVSRTTTINHAQLDVVNSKILHNNGWTLFKNCAYFAKLVWNSVASDKVNTVNLPLSVKIEIKSSKYETNKEMNIPAPSQVFKQIGSGDSAYLVVVTSKSLEGGL